MSTSRRRALAVLLAGTLPLTILLDGGDTSFVFAFGLVTTDPFHLVPVDDYLFVHTQGLPRRLEAWPAGVLLHAGAFACAVWTSVGDEGPLPGRVDPRLTGGLLLLAGLAHAQVAWGLYRTYESTGPLVVPLGALTTWTVVWWYFWPLVRERGLVATGE